MLSKSLIQSSVDGWGCVPSLLFNLRPNLVEVLRIMVTSFKRSHDALLHSVPRPRSRPLSTHAPTRRSWTLMGRSGSVSCGSLAPFSWVLVHIRSRLCPPRVYFPVLCKFWQIYGTVNGDFLQEDLCHTHTQSPCSCGRTLPTRTSTGDAQTQFCLSLCGVPGSWCAQGLFEPS